MKTFIIWQSHEASGGFQIFAIINTSVKILESLKKCKFSRKTILLSRLMGVNKNYLSIEAKNGFETRKRN